MRFRCQWMELSCRPVACGNGAYGQARRQPGRHLALCPRQPQGRGHQGGIDTRRASRRRPAAPARPRAARRSPAAARPRGVTCTTTGAAPGARRSSRDPPTAGAPWRPAGAARQEPRQPGLVGRQPGPQLPPPVREPRAVPQQAPGVVIRLHDPSPPIQVEHPPPGRCRAGRSRRCPAPPRRPAPAGPGQIAGYGAAAL